ncbi:MAG: Phosphoglucomutase [Firmicutes bacterium ADurb.Bin193]|nr:MAG: Phosphoglucomutase [Firmicutes bacterium ADurb.Bin193]
MADYLDEYEKWLSSEYVDDDEKRELIGLKGNDSEIKDRFYRHLEFGTAGLRGIIGAGTNRMNKHVVRRITRGIAEYILKFGGDDAKKRGVAIAYDCRRLSDYFALEAALVFAANGISAYLFDALRPTPELSFTVRHLGAIAGINITASHNPPNYNGYKVYWEDGGQLPPHISDAVLEIINATPLFPVPTMAKDEAMQKGLVKIIGREVDEAFINAVYKQAINTDSIARMADKFKIVYTPLHGTGNKPVREILNKVGFRNVLVVKEQELPDSEFSTVKSPNPENIECYDMALELAKKEDADIIIATDPDADRVGTLVRTSDGEYTHISGNQLGAILAHYILSSKSSMGTLPKNAAVVSTVVSTGLTKAVCKRFGATYFETLTGFKFIGEKIHEFEKEGKYEYVFGFEESYGYLAGTHARDKDGIVASMLVAEMAAHYAEKGKTLFDVTQDLYKEYGWFLEDTVCVFMDGIDGLEKINGIMKDLRDKMPKEIGGLNVLAIRDYKAGLRYDLKSGEQSPTGLPESDVLIFELEGGTNFAVRPSGTEPKIKNYYLIYHKTKEGAEEILSRIKSAAEKIIW